MKMKLTYILLLVFAVFLTACNHRKFCDFKEYEEIVRICYKWNLVVNEPIPGELELEVVEKNAANALTMHTTPNEFYSLENLVPDNYNLFAYNETENIEVRNRTFYAATNQDGSVKSVGCLYASENNFKARDPEEIALEEEKNSNHHWPEPPYHVGSDIVYQDVPMEMIPQTREINVVIKFTEGSMDYIESVAGVISGISQSKQWPSNFLTQGPIAFDFVIEGDKIIAKYRVLGVYPGATNNLDFQIQYNDGSESYPLSIDLTGKLFDFNDKLGGDPAIVEIELDVKRDPNFFEAVILDWDIIESGDNSDLEI